MLFNTPVFALFFVAVFALAWSLSNARQARVLLLVAASYLFYAYWDWRFAGLLAVSSVINYAVALALGNLVNTRARLAVVTLGIVYNVALLGFFKYYNFFLVSFGMMMEQFGLERELPFLNIIMPLAVSFYTFQGISYIVDVYKRAVVPSRSLPDIMLYLSFFAQLTSGPIVRAPDFLPQIQAQPKLTWPMVNLGFLLIALGLFKKMVLANYMATDIVDEVFFDPTMHSGIDLMTGLFAYTIQVYADFSGYTNMALGLGLLMGFRFNTNFDQPYRAASVSEYWRRWHISLSTWLRDYFFRPLRGASRSKALMMVLTFVTMFVCGLWHGASWTFVAWGTMHGVWLILERMVGWGKDIAKGWGPWLAGFVVTIIFVSLTRIFFRAEEFETSMFYWEALASLENWSKPAVLTTPFVTFLILFGMSFSLLPNMTKPAGTLVMTRLAWPLIGLFLGLSLVVIDAVGPGGVTRFIYESF